MSLDALPKTRAVLDQGRADGLHHGAQLFVSHRGKTICDAGMGEVRPGEPLSPDHFMLWLSAGKPVTAVMVLMCCFEQDADGIRSLDDRVQGLLGAEWEDAGIGQVTVRQLLTHTGGFPEADPGYPANDWETSLAALQSATLEEEWELGRTGGYHPKSSWFVLGEIILSVRELRRQSLADLLREDVLRLAGANAARFQFDLDDLRGELRALIAPMFRRQGRELVDAGMSDDTHLTRISPGSSLRGPARDLGRFYLTLLGSIKEGGSRMLSGMAAEAMTARHRVGEFDRTLGHVVDFGLGVIVDSNRYGADTVPYGYGPHCSPRTFGHGGSQSSMGFCDPENDLVVAWATNGMCGEPKHQRRNRAINAAIYEDLGLAD